MKTRDLNLQTQPGVEIPRLKIDTGATGDKKQEKPNEKSTKRHFDPDFLFGVASSAYQTEGAYEADGKEKNIFDFRYHVIQSRAVTPFDVSCDSYHLYKKDVAIIKQLGFKVYSFSISWTRIMVRPAHFTYLVNKKGIAYYNGLINELIDNGIEPMVTMFYRDFPQDILDSGRDYEQFDYIFHFRNYAEVLFKNFGDRVKYWITFNDPFRDLPQYMFMKVPYADIPGHPEDSKPYRSFGKFMEHAKYVLQYHAIIYRLYDQRFRPSQKGKVSIAINADYYLPYSTAREDIEITSRVWDIHFGMFADVLYHKEYRWPESIEIDEKKLFHIAPFDDLYRQALYNRIKGTSDFFAITYYQAFRCAHGNPDWYIPDNISAHTRHITRGDLLDKYFNVTFLPDPRWPVSYGDLNVVPWGLRESLLYIKHRYNNPPVFVVESGYSGEPGIMNDVDRLEYHRECLREIYIAKEEFGCNVIGYNVWSLLDMPDWDKELNVTFGIVGVNHTDPNRRRKIKLSALYLEKLMRNGVFPSSIV